MVMVPSTGFPDGEFFDEAMAETFQAFEEQVVIKRFSATVGGNPVDGVAPTKQYLSIQATALIEALTAQEIASATGFYQAGDIKAQFRQQVYGAEGGANGAQGGDLQSAGRYSDLIVFRGREYKIVGHAERIHYGGQYYWSVVLRQAKA
jgi:hypothetical protein